MPQKRPPIAQPVNKSLPDSPEKNYTFLFLSILIIYTLLIIWGISNHEQWRDEAQAWLIVRDSSLAELFSILRTEGHPPLWYMLIMPLAKTGMPYLFQNLLSAAIMIAAVYLLLFKTKLPVLVKCLLPFSYFFLFEYSLFARSYCLIPFFTIALLHLYPMRFKKPWLYALCITGLFNTHVLVFTFCAMLALLFLVDIYQQKLKDKNIIGSALLMSVGGGYLLPYLFMAKMTDEFHKGIDDNIGQMMKAINNGLLISQSAVLALLLLATAIVLLAKNKKALLLLLGGMVSVLYILGYKYAASGFRHQGVIFFILLAGAYIASANYNGQLFSEKATFRKLPVYWVLLAIIILQLKPSFERYQNDSVNTFSGAKDAAAFITEQKLDKKIIIGHQSWAASALLPFMDKDTRMYYGECRRYGTYYVYDTCFINERWRYFVETSVDAAYINFKGKLDSLVFVFNFPVTEKGMRYLDLLYSTPEMPVIQDEFYYFYKFKKGVR